MAECDLRYAGQGFELTLALEPVRDLAARFHRAHQERYGFHDASWPIEVVNLRSHVTAAGRGADGCRTAAGAPRGRAGVRALDGATLWVAPGWTARRRRDGAWVVTR